MKYEEFVHMVAREAWIGTRPKHIRIGQSLFNFLHDKNPVLANKLRGTDVDPFYNDNRIPEAWKFIYENWDESQLTTEQK